MNNTPHKAGFVNIIGKPNVGKSTLMNKMVNEKISIITSKAQTTRHRIMGILNGKDFQIVYSDTPGIIKPKYELHRLMMKFINKSFEDADIILFITDIYEDPHQIKQVEENLAIRLEQVKIPLFILLNKIDLTTEDDVKKKMDLWSDFANAREIIPISALHNFNTDKVFKLILEELPIHPPFYSKDEITDRPERFFASEIIREKIFLNYNKEVPYSSEVVITDFKEKNDIIYIRAEIFVERNSQKGIIIGKKGSTLKRVGIQARKDLELFFDKKVFLEQFVKVEPNWRSKIGKLGKFGYN